MSNCPCHCGADNCRGFLGRIFHESSVSQLQNNQGEEVIIDNNQARQEQVQSPLTNKDDDNKDESILEETNESSDRLHPYLEIAYDDDPLTSALVSVTSLIFQAMKYDTDPYENEDEGRIGIVRTLNNMVKKHQPPNGWVYWEEVSKLNFLSQMLDEIASADSMFDKVLCYVQLFVDKYYKEMAVIIQPKEDNEKIISTTPIIIYPNKEITERCHALESFYPVAQIGMNKFIDTTLKPNEEYYVGDFFVTLNDRHIHNRESFCHGNVWGSYAIEIPTYSGSQQFFYGILYGYIVSNGVNSNYFTYKLRVNEDHSYWELSNGTFVVVIITTNIPY